MLKNKSKNKGREHRFDYVWVLKVFLATFIITSILSFSSSKLMEDFNITLSLLALIIIITIGIVFDIIGVSVTAASEVPMISLASKKARGALEAVRLIRNADLVSSICNDIVGDICGIISGSAGSILVIRLTSGLISWDITILSILISSLIAAFTVGGKALGKSVAIRNCQSIVFSVGYIMSFFSIQNHEFNSYSKRRNRKNGTAGSDK
ncbi:MAG TPA: Mg2+ and Co2+ transporter CorB [Candidatus Atribacteria bacterium]|nr:Mg2+ and Co2+ transporter CorB [Candidatus Atribacteria bacterium]HPT77893.1 Mg2+ and Co2+ transporter CorB [Candidatus Atribacteria bacterium]